MERVEKIFDPNAQVTRNPSLLRRFKPLTAEIGKPVRIEYVTARGKQREEGLLVAVAPFESVETNHAGLPFVGNECAIARITNGVGSEVFRNERAPFIFLMRVDAEKDAFRSACFGREVADAIRRKRELREADFEEWRRKRDAGKK